MFFVIKDGFIFSCMFEKVNVPKEHEKFVFSSNELLGFSPEIQLEIFNQNNLERITLPPTSSPEDITSNLRELIKIFTLPERRIQMGKKAAKPEVEGQEVAEKAPAGPSKKDSVITLVAEANPKRPSSKAFERFALYQDGMTVGEFLEAGGTMADVNYDTAKGYITVA